MFDKGRHNFLFLHRLLFGCASTVSMVACLGLVQPAEAATTFYLDSLAVGLNGTAIFFDGYDDGSPPPSATQFLNGPATPSYIQIVGDFNFAGAEANSKLELSTLHGAPALTATNHPAILHNATLGLPTSSSFANQLGVNDTFTVSAVFDYKNPDGPNEQFRVSVTDRVGPEGPGDQTNDAIRLAVHRAAFSGSQGAAINPATGQPFSDLNGQVIVGVYKADFVNDTITWLEARAVDLTGNPDQIRLTLEKMNSASTALTASFTYMKNGSDLSTTTFATAPDIFSDEDFTRPQISALQVTGLSTVAAAKLTTGSPTSISQTISQVTSPNLQFKYRFATTTGQLHVILNGIELGTIDAPTTLQGGFQTATIDTSSFLNQLNVALVFLLDGPTGSIILLDDIIFANLANGDFQTGNLSGWTGQSSELGSVGIDLQVQETPLPGALPLFTGGLALMGMLGWRRKRKDVAV